MCNFRRNVVRLIPKCRFLTVAYYSPQKFIHVSIHYSVTNFLKLITFTTRPQHKTAIYVTLPTSDCNIANFIVAPIVIHKAPF